ncbi:hypothetical protein [Antrihabitans spumae]|uniref:Uncharacterized protein n=1 Tax=Antrihabitans spumae TaxID=3373370 RepID=A0ABW7JHU3_9NOCA
MTEPTDVKHLWARLQNAASTGELLLEEGVAAEVAAACEELIQGYGRLIDDATSLQSVRGFGEIESGVQLAQKFSRKAVGGHDALVDRLEEHIAIVTMIQQTVTTAAAKIEGEDHMLTAHLSTIDPQL